MNLLNRLQNLLLFGRGPRLAKLATLIARQIMPEVWPLVAGRVPEMSPAEARGYLRARSAELMRTRIEMERRFDRSLAPRDAASLLTGVSNELLALIEQRRQQAVQQRGGLKRAA
ncbi:MAG: hypothetical protein K2Y37_13020 [Pirellulales bacterium]|nr:hypothetical protein [Pirellulales bacterium]